MINRNENQKGTWMIAMVVFAVIAVAAVASYYYFRTSPTNSPEVQEIKDSGEIIVGFSAGYPPMEDLDENGEAIGFDIDIAREVAKELGVEPRFENILWEDIFDQLRGGKIDIVISAVTITSERAETMAFSNPYFNAGQTVVIDKSDSDEIKGLDDLEGLKLGVEGETTSQEEAEKLTDKDLVISYENYVRTPKDLLDDKLDAVIIDYPAAVRMVKDNKGLVIVGEPFTEEYYGIVTQKGNDGLVKILNKVIIDLKQSGKLKELENKWL